jgi:hypothetical protein
MSWGIRSGSDSWLPMNEVKGRKLVVAEKGERYGILVRNRSEERKEIVMSVDGLDVMDGQSASFKKRGYIVEPHESLMVDGFRTSDGTVAAFRFSDVPDSYAARKHGDTRNVGVIGLAVFSERKFMAPVRTMQPKNRAWQRTKATPFPSSRPYASPPEA